MVQVPAATPVTTPVVDPTVATPVFEDDQIPPPMPSVRVELPPTVVVAVPLIDVGAVSTVIVLVT